MIVSEQSFKYSHYVSCYLLAIELLLASYRPAIGLQLPAICQLLVGYRAGPAATECYSAQKLLPSRFSEEQHLVKLLQ